MPKRLPKFHETFIPLLKVLSDGETMHYRELLESVKDQHFADLPAELLNEKTKSGDLLILNRIGWAKSYLKEGGFVEQPERAMVRITAKGLATLKRGSLTLQELKADPVYTAAQDAKQAGEAKNEERDEQRLENATPQDLIDKGFSAIESEVKQGLIEKLAVIDPYYFEKVILILLKKMGYGDFVETKKSGDGGIDGIINQDQLGLERIYIQAKRYNAGKVRETDIRNFIGAMSGDTSKGVFVTTSTFDQSAIEKARDAHHKIILIDGPRLTTLMYEYGVGVQVKDVYKIKEIDQDFFDDV
jgi:restriction system protein